jgi:hypothetical protein
MRIAYKKPDFVPMAAGLGVREVRELVACARLTRDRIALVDARDRERIFGVIIARTGDHFAVKPVIPKFQRQPRRGVSPAVLGGVSPGGDPGYAIQERRKIVIPDPPMDLNLGSGHFLTRLWSFMASARLSAGPHMPAPLIAAIC